MGIKMDNNPGYVVIPLSCGVAMFAVVAPDGAIVSEHRSVKSALAKARRLNRAPSSLSPQQRGMNNERHH
jgi:hypothetical protein